VPTNFLKVERAELERFLPGLDHALVAIGMAVLEQDGSPGIAAFKAAGGPGLLIREDLGGRGAGPVSAVRIQRALGSRSPSLAVATTMHHFSIATMIEMTNRGLESMLLEAVAKQSLLVASGFGEGRPDQGILSPEMRGTRAGKSIVLSGRKRPCSLGESMDLLTVSVNIGGNLAVVLVPASLPGLERVPFWRSPALMGAQSCEVILNDVAVPERLVSYAGTTEDLDATQIGAFLWFEVLIAASYIGAVSALVERALARQRQTSSHFVAALGAIEMAMAAVEHAAETLSSPTREEDMLGRTLSIRYGAQDALCNAAALAAELLGGSQFATVPEIALLLACSRALAFHPPSRTSMAAPLGDWLAGGRLLLTREPGAAGAMADARDPG
jgi:alkylation response protein AidB-like acyl-CoA dehydrogenase